MVAIAMQIPPEKEWENFNNREPSLLKPDHKPLDPARVSFPFSDHELTKPLIEATLARKSTMLKRRTISFYVLSAAGFLLEYKDHDPITNPEPTLCLKLSDCELGNSPARSGKAGFTITGKDAGKYFGGTHEYIFRTDGMEQATQWWTKLERFVGSAPRPDNAAAAAATDSEVEDSPVSPKQFDGAAVPGQVAQTAQKTEMPSTTTAGPAPTAHATAAPTITAAPVDVRTTAPTPTATAAPTTAAQSAA